MAEHGRMCHLCVRMLSSCSPYSSISDCPAMRQMMADFAYVVLAHTARHIALVLEDEERRSH
jgi:hypothetical protein